MGEMKQCNDCLETLSLSEFFRDRKRTRCICKTCDKARYYAWVEANYEKSMVIQARARAKRKSLPFSLRAEDVVVPDTCPICDVVLRRGVGQAELHSPSLDRVVPSLGYTRENCVVICNGCNSRKWDSTPEMLIAIAGYITRIREERGLA